MNNNNRQAAWWKIALTGPDQLRQRVSAIFHHAASLMTENRADRPGNWRRVAFALSEIFVVSDVNDILAGGNPEALANYQDLLARDAFGNFRQLLEDITLSPIMGSYLSHLRNAKADPAHATSPDENYAREVMQLFTIGLNELQPDGTLKLDAAGLPIPTYDQATIVETARVFTGWGFYSPAPKPNFRGARQNYFEPMMFYPAFHDDGEKVIVDGVKIRPRNEGGAKDLRLTLDTLFNHPNLAPFICRQLIQRLVTRATRARRTSIGSTQVFAKNARASAATSVRWSGPSCSITRRARFRSRPTRAMGNSRSRCCASRPCCARSKARRKTGAITFPIPRARSARRRCGRRRCSTSSSPTTCCRAPSPPRACTRPKPRSSPRPPRSRCRTTCRVISSRPPSRRRRN